MPTPGKRRGTCVLAVVAVASSISCASSSSPTNPSPRSATLRMTVDPNPIVQNGMGACVGRSGTQPGNFRLFPHSITIEETAGVGAALQSFQITAVVGTQEFPVLGLDQDSIGNFFGDCDGSGNRIDARQRRCNSAAMFCNPVSVSVPNQLRMRFTGTDDNGNALSGESSVPLSVP